MASYVDSWPQRSNLKLMISAPAGAQIKVSPGNTYPKCPSVRPLTKPLVWKPAGLQLGCNSICYFSDQLNTQLQYVEQNIVCSNDWLYVCRVLLSVCSRRNRRVRPKALKSDVLILGSCVLLYLGWERLKCCLSEMLIIGIHPTPPWWSEKQVPKHCWKLCRCGPYAWIFVHPSWKLLDNSFYKRGTREVFF